MEMSVAIFGYKCLAVLNFFNYGLCLQRKKFSLQSSEKLSVSISQASPTA